MNLCIRNNLLSHIFFRIQAAPVLIPFTPIKDIADEAKVKLHKDMEASTPPDMKLPMQGIRRILNKVFVMKRKKYNVKYFYSSCDTGRIQIFIAANCTQK